MLAGETVAVTEFGVRSAVPVTVPFDQIVGWLRAAVQDAARAVSELALYRPSPGAVTAVAVAGWLVICHLRRRQLATRAVREALAAPDPDTRRAAVLVAACHGVGRYANTLVRWVDSETLESVLLPLAEVVCDPRTSRRGRWRKQLHRWAEAYFEAWARASCERAELARPADTAVPAAPLLHSIDALVAVAQPVQPPPPTRGPAARRRRWRAGPDELDALKVVEGLGRLPRARKAPPATEASGQRRDLEVLVDELVGVGPRTRRIELAKPRSSTARPVIAPPRRERPALGPTAAGARSGGGLPGSPATAARSPGRLPRSRPAAAAAADPPGARSAHFKGA